MNSIKMEVSGRNIQFSYTKILPKKLGEKKFFLLNGQRLLISCCIDVDIEIRCGLFFGFQCGCSAREIVFNFL